MYGIVNRAIEELVITNYGEKNWETIKAASGIDVEYFISNEPYDDDISYKLTSAIATVMNVSHASVLQALGEWWILKTSKEKYSEMLSAGGDDMKTFLMNLPDFHTRVALMYPKLTPPEFKVSDVVEKSLHLHYFSTRPGLQEFVRGLLQGLCKLFNTPADIQLLQSRHDGASHEIFKVSWA
jgi:hypothetical protein